MSGCARLSDKDTGHGCFHGRQNIEASSDVFVDKKGVHRKGDRWITHCCHHHGCHSAQTSTGSSSVFVNGKPVARIGDSLSCGGVIIEGSGTVFIG